MHTIKKIFLVSLALLLSVPVSYFSQSFPIIPKPVSIENGEGFFTIDRNTTITFAEGSNEVIMLAQILAGSIEAVSGIKTALKSGTVSSNKIEFVFDPGTQEDEGYKIDISPKKIVIKGKTGAGLFYGIQTLIQLFPLEKTETIKLNNAVIVDYPRFKWRGVHLDVCRHFFPVEFVKKYIDVLAMYKINTFHWHLTEDQGWRIEIKKYPELTKIGSVRKETMGDGIPHGGFYTQDQIRDVVEYAKNRYITVVPEIEMPGHALAALTAFPEFSCTGGPFEVGTVWGVYEDVFCAGNDKTFEFLENILSEVMELFPSEYIHIGGDEVPKIRWENCEKCQARIKNENLKDEHELQSYFIQRIEKFLNARGRKIIGWDEILEGGLAPNAAVMSWRGTEGGIAAAKMKHNVVMSPGTHCYFDHYQGLSGEPKAFGGYTPIEKVYSYEPVPEELTVEESKYIMGAQANLWSERLESTDHVEYMLLPRLCALSEVVWSKKESRNASDFFSRLTTHYDLLTKKNYNFRIPPPLNESGELLLDRNDKITLSSPVRNGSIYYTLDGTEPGINSLPYTDPLWFSSPQLLKAKTFLPNGKSSPTATVQISFVDTTKNGLLFKYFEGEWDSLPDFDKMKPVREGKIYKLDIGRINPRQDYFGLDLNGFINIEKEGDYTFFLTSDDGSKLLINNRVVVDNDGLHSDKEVSSKIFLKTGLYPFRIFYFEKFGGQSLKAEFEGPGFRKKLIPANLLFFNNQ